VHQPVRREERVLRSQGDCHPNHLRPVPQSPGRFRRWRSPHLRSPQAPGTTGSGTASVQGRGCDPLAQTLPGPRHLQSIRVQCSGGLLGGRGLWPTTAPALGLSLYEHQILACHYSAGGLTCWMAPWKALAVEVREGRGLALGLHPRLAAPRPQSNSRCRTAQPAHRRRARARHSPSATGYTRGPATAVTAFPEKGGAGVLSCAIYSG